MMDLNESTMSNEVSSGKRPPKLRQSCESCRSTKGKCVPSEKIGKQCQRCVKEGQQCVFLEAKPRPKRAKSSRIRVAEMEEKLDGLMVLLASRQFGNGATPSESSSAPSQIITSISLPAADSQSLTQPSEYSAPSSSLQETDNRAFTKPSASSASSIFCSNFDSLRSQQPLPVFSFPNFDTFNDVISKGIVGFGQAEESVRFFQSKASNFPFVIVPPKMTLDSLRRDRPFLLLSIIAFAAFSNEKLQLQLELELRESLSKRVLVNCEKSLDLLQGVLTYLAWYHFYFETEREQIYQLSQMAAAMAVDLGINHAMHDIISADYRVQKNKPLALLPKNSPEELEAQRTFLGCYYLTSSICQGLRKPNSLKYCDYLETCAQSLIRAAQAETDYLLPYYIHLQRLAEEVEHAFDYGQNLRLPHVDAMRIEILLKAFEQQLSQIELNFPTNIWNNASLTMRFYHLRIYVNEIGFRATKPSDMEVMSSTHNLRSWYYSAARSESLIHCLQATKDYLDRYLSLASEEIANFIMTDLISLVYAVLLLGAFATGACDSEALDIAHIKQTANLDYYLDALSDQALHQISVSKAGSNNYMSHMYGLFQQSKIWYSQIIKDPTPIGSSAVGHPHPSCSFMEIIPTIMARCVEYSGLMPGAFLGFSEVSSSDEQWTEMLSSWAVTQDIVLDAAPR